jgi:hypothetical protein
VEEDVENKEVQKNGVNQSLQQKIFSNDDIIKLMTDIVCQSNTDRDKAIKLYEKLTEKDYDQLHEITMKSDAVIRSLELAGKSTDRLNILLQTIQKFNTDKTQKEIAEKILTSDDKNDIIDLMDAMNIGPKRLLKYGKDSEKINKEIDNIEQSIPDNEENNEQEENEEIVNNEEEYEVNPDMMIDENDISLNDVVEWVETYEKENNQ